MPILKLNLNLINYIIKITINQDKLKAKKKNHKILWFSWSAHREA